MSDWTWEYVPDAANVVAGLTQAQIDQAERLASRIADAVAVRRIGTSFDVGEGVPAGWDAISSTPAIGRQQCGDRPGLAPVLGCLPAKRVKHHVGIQLKQPEKSGDGDPQTAG